MARVVKDTRPVADQATSETACTYAALILHEDNQDIDATKLAKILKAANLKVEPIWPKVFEKALKGKSVSNLLHGSTGTAVAAPQQTTAAAVAADTKKPEPVKEVKKVEEPEEDVDMGGLFD